MKVTGKIYKQRPYLTDENSTMDCITFVKLQEGVVFRDDRIVIIPILYDGRRMTLSVGENVEVNGEIQFMKITTVYGEHSSDPLPVMLANSIERAS